MRNSCGSFSICSRGSREHVVVLAIGLLFLQRQGILPTTMAGLDEGCGRWPGCFNVSLWSQPNTSPVRARQVCNTWASFFGVQSEMESAQAILDIFDEAPVQQVQNCRILGASGLACLEFPWYFCWLYFLHFLTCLRCPSPLSFHLVGFSSWHAVHTFIRSCSEIDSAFELPCWHKDNASMTLRAVQSKNQPCDWKQCWSNPKCKK